MTSTNYRLLVQSPEYRQMLENYIATLPMQTLAEHDYPELKAAAATGKHWAKVDLGIERRELMEVIMGQMRVNGAKQERQLLKQLALLQSFVVDNDEAEHQIGNVLAMMRTHDFSGCLCAPLLEQLQLN